MIRMEFINDFGSEFHKDIKVEIPGENSDIQDFVDCFKALLTGVGYHHECIDDLFYHETEDE